MRLKIYGTGSALPAKKVSNDLLSEYMDTSDEWIRSRTGIVNRRLAMEETTSSLAVEAGRKALEDAKAAPEEVEIVIVATFTPDCSLPSTACIVQDQLGLTHAVAFDLNAACSGFLFALNTVQAYFSAGVYRTALVIGRTGEPVSCLETVQAQRSAGQRMAPPATLSRNRTEAAEPY